MRLTPYFLVLATFLALMQGPQAHTATEGVPQIVLVVSSLAGVVGLISAYGAWQEQQWGIVVSIIVEAVNGILALPGVLVAPSVITRVAAVLSVLIALAVIVALLLRDEPHPSIEYESMFKE
jgi:uncharacterized membrane protein (DUF2068 family)